MLFHEWVQYAHELTEKGARFIIVAIPDDGGVFVGGTECPKCVAGMLDAEFISHADDEGNIPNPKSMRKPQ